MTSPFFIILVGFFTLAVSLNQELLLAPALSALYLYITGLVASQLALSWRRGARGLLKSYQLLSSTKLLRLSVLARLYEDLSGSLSNTLRFYQSYPKFFNLVSSFHGVSSTDFQYVSKKRFYFNFIAEVVLEQFLFIKNRFLFFSSRPLDRVVKKLLFSRPDVSYSSLNSSLQRRSYSTTNVNQSSAGWWFSNQSSF